MRRVRLWRVRRGLPLAALALLVSGGACQRMVPAVLPPVLVQPVMAAPASQNPSPMVEETRPHTRLPATAMWAGWRDSLVVPGLARPAWLLVAARDTAATAVELLAFFHGAVHVAQAAADSAPVPTAVLAVSVGSGGTAYDGAFARDSAALWPALLAAAEAALARRRGAPVPVTRQRLAGFSAGYGAIRAILREPALAARVDGVLLLDGLHTGYLPDRTPLAEGGAVDTVPLLPFLAYARRAMAGEVALFVSHSEVFPGTFASTTESVGWLLARAGVPRQPVLAWGPVGMQQTSVARRGRLEVRGFAGNSAPDHLDHLHALPQWVRDGVGR